MVTRSFWQSATMAPCSFRPTPLIPQRELQAFSRPILSYHLRSLPIRLRLFFLRLVLTSLDPTAFPPLTFSISPLISKAFVQLPVHFYFASTTVPSSSLLPFVNLLLRQSDTLVVAIYVQRPPRNKSCIYISNFNLPYSLSHPGSASQASAVAVVNRLPLLQMSMCFRLQL